MQANNVPPRARADARAAQWITPPPPKKGLRARTLRRVFNAWCCLCWSYCRPSKHCGAALMLPARPPIALAPRAVAAGKPSPTSRVLATICLSRASHHMIHSVCSSPVRLIIQRPSSNRSTGSSEANRVFVQPRININCLEWRAAVINCLERDSSPQFYVRKRLIHYATWAFARARKAAQG